MSDQDQDKDPVVHSSLSKPLYISSILLVLSLAWGLYDEMYGIRPWKGYEARFVKLYSTFLRQQMGGESAAERQIKSQPDYQRLDREAADAEKKVMPQLAQIDQRVNNVLVPRIMALNEPFQEVRSHIGALTYQIETTSSESTKNSLRQQIAEIKKEVKYVRLPGDSDKKAYTYDQMDHQLQDWKTEKAQKLEERVALMKPANDLRTARDKYLSDRIADASMDTLAGVERSLDTFDIRIRQIHIKDVDLVDRCESCHLGTREPVTLTAAAMGGQAVFASHPGDKELLKIHDPDKLGCTPCHGGNGAAVSSIEKAHGYNEHWLWPLHHEENVQAGCQQCHA